MAMPDNNKEYPKDPFLMIDQLEKKVEKLENKYHRGIHSLDERVRQMEKGFFDLDARIKVDGALWSSDDPVKETLLKAELEVVRSDEMTQEEKDKAVKAIEEVRRKRDDDPYKSHDTVDGRDLNDLLLKHYRLLVKENAELNKERNKVLNVVLQQFHKEHPTTKDGECMLRRCKEIVQQEMGSPDKNTVKNSGSTHRSFGDAHGNITTIGHAVEFNEEAASPWRGRVGVVEDIDKEGFPTIFLGGGERFFGVSPKELVNRSK